MEEKWVQLGPVPNPLGLTDICRLISALSSQKKKCIVFIFKLKKLNAKNFSNDLLQVAKIIQWEKDNLFNKWCRENQISTCRRMKLDPYLTSDIKMDHKLRDIRLGNDCLSTTTKAQAVKLKIDKWGTLKNFCT